MWCIARPLGQQVGAQPPRSLATIHALTPSPVSPSTGLTQWASLSTTSPATQTAPPGIGIGHAASRAARWHAYAGVVLRHGAGPTGQQAGPAARVDIHAYLEHEATDPSQAAHDALAGLDWAEFGLRHDASGPVPTLHDETGMPGPLRSCVVVLHLAPARTAGQTPKPLAPRAQVGAAPVVAWAGALIVLICCESLGETSKTV